jgi:hypothetical protein
VFTNSSAFLQNLFAKLTPTPDRQVQDTVHTAYTTSAGMRAPLESRQTIKGKNFYRGKLAMLLNGRVDVATPHGKIVDILTATEVIEVKSVDEWQTALAQVRSYGQHYPLHRKRIHLFGPMPAKKLLHIQQQCFREGVVVTWEDE